MAYRNPSRFNITCEQYTQNTVYALQQQFGAGNVTAASATAIRFSGPLDISVEVLNGNDNSTGQRGDPGPRCSPGVCKSTRCLLWTIVRIQALTDRCAVGHFTQPACKRHNSSSAMTAVCCSSWGCISSTATVKCNWMLGQLSQCTLMQSVCHMHSAG